MKKFLFSLLCLLAAFQLLAQQPNISNPGFEQWSGTTPNGWTTSITGAITGVSIIGSFPISFNFGSKATEAHSGNYALKLQSKGINLSLVGGPEITLPGIAQLGIAGSFSISVGTLQQLMSVDSTTDFSTLLDNLDMEELSTITNVFSKGEPFTMVPSAMKVWVKYLPPVGTSDTMLVLVGAYKTGETSLLLLGDIPESYGYYAVTERLENYTELTVPISFDAEDVNCDSLVIVFVSSSFMNANMNTVLYIDDISFEFDYTSVESTERVKMNLYPNPASEYFILSLDNQSDMYDITLYDINGRQIKKLERLTGDTRVSVNELSSGTYFLKVQQAGNTTVRKFVVE